MAASAPDVAGDREIDSPQAQLGQRAIAPRQVELADQVVGGTVIVHHDHHARYPLMANLPSDGAMAKVHTEERHQQAAFTADRLIWYSSMQASAGYRGCRVGASAWSFFSSAGPDRSKPVREERTKKSGNETGHSLVPASSLTVNAHAGDAIGCRHGWGRS